MSNGAPLTKQKKGLTTKQNSTPADLNQFLKSRYAKPDESPTNNRIGDPKSSSLPGGKYSILDEDYDEFLRLYAEEFKKGNKIHYYTEKQLPDRGPILIDIDLRFSYKTEERIYKKDNVNELLYLYLEELKQIYMFDESTRFSVYIFEKPCINRVEEKQITKDGIHIIIGIHAEREAQTYLRDRIIAKIEATDWSKIPIVNVDGWKDVIDKSITNGNTGWPLYGSRKPHHEAYELTRKIEVEYDPIDGQMMMDDVKLPPMGVELLKEVSARNKTHPHFLYTAEFAQKCSSLSSSRTPHTQQSRTLKNYSIRNSENNRAVLTVKSETELNELYSQFLTYLNENPMNYSKKETCLYTMALSERFYGTGSYMNWLKVGWVLRNTHDDMFIVWVKFSSQWSQFDYKSIPDLFERWITFDINHTQTDTNLSKGLTHRSIMYWCKNDFDKDVYTDPKYVNPKYQEIRESSMEHFINESLKRPKCGDVDLAKVLYESYKDKYCCSSIKDNTWYHFTNHRWRPDEMGTTLRAHISNELRDLYEGCHKGYSERANVLEAKDELIPKEELELNALTKKIAKIADVVKQLGESNSKDRIMKEAKEVFYDRYFNDNIDKNPYLMCFTNGVYDLKNGVFRDGLPEDYITKTTNLFYEPVDEDIPQHKKRIAEIHDFMAKLFPIPEVREYMWEHLASTLVGESTPTTQTLHMYVGAGCNGKSALVDLMAMILGEYRAVAPLSLITDKRAKLGGTSTEIIELKGVRYAVLNEPSVDDIINEGVMKSLTGGTDQIQGRALYQNKTISYNPQFKLVVCSNVLMKVRSNDDGTWRRIRVIDFISKFVAHPDPNIPYQFKIEPINKKFSEWKELFMAMLIEIAVRTQGNVCECAQVMKSSQAYKDGQDIFADFIDARIRIDPDRELKFSDLSAQIALWFTNEKERPDKKKILEYFKKKYGEPVGKGIATTWRGIYIEKQEDTDSEEEDEDP